jgi:hypothetical protein
MMDKRVIGRYSCGEAEKVSIFIGGVVRMES